MSDLNGAVPNYSYAVQPYAPNAPVVGIFDNLELAKQSIADAEAQLGFLVKWEESEKSPGLLVAKHFDESIVGMIKRYENNVLYKSNKVYTPVQPAPQSAPVQPPAPAAPSEPLVYEGFPPDEPLPDYLTPFSQRFAMQPPSSPAPIVKPDEIWPDEWIPTR